MNDILQYQQYYASVHFSTDDEIFYGRVLGINDLVSFEGTSVKDLKKSFRDAVEDYIDTCKTIGKEPEKTYKGTFNVRVPVDLHKEAAHFAAVHDITLNELVKVALSFTLDRKKEVDQVIGKRKRPLQKT
jgi:predicted HicB family RNase H-like nuclease